MNAGLVPAFLFAVVDPSFGTWSCSTVRPLGVRFRSVVRRSGMWRCSEVSPRCASVRECLSKAGAA